MTFEKLLILVVFCLFSSYLAEAQPNVLLIMTDDQGYGDISAHGNPVLKTPEIDKLYKQSVRFTDFHVAPMCTPTRGQLLTGYDAMHNGATAVSQGRSMVKRNIRIMPQYFLKKGYATGLFGKWHLGDSYPHRPRFRGFEEVVSFRAWGITSLADYWGNSYFDPVLMYNGEDKKYKGYCTDIFFDEAMKYMEKCQAKNKPFFVYIPTNTPHKPELVPEQYSKPYKGVYEGKKIPSEFYGMIANIDENIGKLEGFLEKSGLKDNTILIFLTDNGTQSSTAQNVYNAGMRGKKGTEYEGGHRVPLYIRWINGKLQHGKDINELTQVQDLLPTLIELCKLDDEGVKFDGTSLAGLLKGEQEQLADRMCVSQFRTSGELWNSAVVMWNKWRLMEETELYNITNDPGQQNNLFEMHSDVAKKMSDYYGNWHVDAKKQFDEKRFVIVGAKESQDLTLYASDWQGSFCDNSGGLKKPKGKNGYWDLLVAEKGTYQIELRRWSEESGKTLLDSYDGKSKEGSFPIAMARIQLSDHDYKIETKVNDTFAGFEVKLDKGKTQLSTSFLNENGDEICGALFVKIVKKGVGDK